MEYVEVLLRKTIEHINKRVELEKLITEDGSFNNAHSIELTQHMREWNEFMNDVPEEYVNLIHETYMTEYNQLRPRH